MENEKDFTVGYKWMHVGNIVKHQYTDRDGSVTGIEFDMNELTPDFETFDDVVKNVLILGIHSGIGDKTKDEAGVLTPEERREYQKGKWSQWCNDRVFRVASERTSIKKKLENATPEQQVVLRELGLIK